MTRGSARRAKDQKPRTVLLGTGDLVPDPDQPRKTLSTEALSGLSRSLLETGQISPIVVRPGSEGQYIIVVGERRWRAAKEAGVSHLECIVRYDLDDQNAREMQLAENYQREDIPVLEQAKCLKSYLDTYKVSQSELSRRTGIPQRTVSARLSLLKLPASMHARIEAGEIGPYEATRIATLPPDQQETVAEAIASGRIGGRALEKVVHPEESSLASNGMPQEEPQPIEAREMTIGLSQRLQNLEKAVDALLETYAFNELARIMGSGEWCAPPCPECAKRGTRVQIWASKRRRTLKEYQEVIELIDSTKELSEEEKEEALEREPKYVIEAKCTQCGFTEVLDFAEE